MPTKFFLVGLWIISKGSRYKRIFAPEHYVELAQSLSAATAAGCYKINEPPSDPPTDDSRVFVTSADVAVMYTVNQEDEGFEHHFSISIAGRYTPRAVGGTFTVYFAQLLGVDLADLHVGVFRGTVYHSVFRITPDGQAEFENRAIVVPSLEDAADVHEECLEASRELQCEPFRLDAA